nr:hypothetical protein [Candidatus Sigynarchaeum springense]
MNRRSISTKKVSVLLFSLLACLNVAMGAVRFTPGFELGFHYPRYLVIHPFNPGTETGTEWIGEMVSTLGRGSGITRLGIAAVIRTLDWSDAYIQQHVDLFTSAAEEHDVALLLHLDSEHFYESRSDLWNWWNASLPGYDPANAGNVEWSDWNTPTKKGFLNWGSPIELAPRLCFESAAVRAEISNKCQVIVDRLVPWLDHLAAIGRSDLFIGIDPGWETGIDSYENVDWVPVTYRHHLGYNALAKRGFNATNPPLDIEAERYDVVHDFAEFEVKTIADKGIPTDKLFTHIWGAESISSAYHLHAPLGAAFNSYSVPGFSLYGYDRETFAAAVSGKRWALMEAPPADGYGQLLSMGTLDVMVLYNWGGNIRNDPAKIEAIKWLLASRY